MTYDIPCFFKRLLNIPISHKGHTRRFSFRVAKEWAQQFCFHNSRPRIVPSVSQRSRFPQSSKVHLHGDVSWQSESKIITELSDAINISESQGIKRLGPGADAGRALGRGVQRPPQPGLQLRGIDTADGEPGSGETPGTVPASEIN